MKSIRNATLLSLAQRYVAFIIQLLTSIVLARLLSPSETGIFSLAAAIVSIAQLMRDFGIGEYVVQEKNLTSERLRSVLGVSVIIAWSVAILLFVSAGKISDYYQETGVSTVVHVLALNFLLLPIGTTTFSVLTKEMAFKELFWIQTLSALVVSALSITLAWQGHSYMSLAWGSVAGSLTNVLLLGIVRPAQTFMLPQFSGIREICRFGGTITAGRLFDQICRRAPDMMIAQSLGFHAVGINSKAGSLLDAFQDFFVSGISRVATPAFAKSLHNNGDTKTAYLKSIEILAVIPLAFFLLLLLMAEALIYLLFGENWLEAVALVRIGALGGLLATPYFLAPPILTAHGQVKIILQVQFFGGTAFLFLLYFAVTHSLEAVALAGVLGSFIKICLLQSGLRKCIDLGWLQLLAACKKSAIIAVLTLLVTAPTILLYEGTTKSAFSAVASSSVMATLTLTICLFIFEHPISNELKTLWNKWTTTN